jgi:hypothetical protein
MDAETPSGGRDRTEMDQGLCTGEEEDVPPEAPRQELRPRGMTLFTGTLALEGLGRHHLDHDVIQPHGRFGGRLGSSGTCGMLEKPLEG